MLGHDLEATVLQRVIALRPFALLRGVELGELATLAQNVVETRLEPGASIVEAGESFTGAHFVVEGALETPTLTTGPGAVVGLLELFANQPARARVRATTATRTLRIDAEDLAEVVEDNFGVLVAALRMVAELDLGSQSPRVALPAGARASLGLVERLFVLRSQSVFARARLRGLATLAHASHELVWEHGTVIATPDRPAAGAYMILDGKVAAGAGNELAAGDAFGLRETLAGRAHLTMLEAVGPVRALATPGAMLLDVLEDQTDLGLAILRALARDVLASA